ncbi:hypothetical protein KPL39_02010 [Clostridium gasigenes]|uniref:hypothetical protein n=1 Tax=Clostridium gasigenes TaxID=94869 RepID=UPI001C0BA66F|nr:hypothetical protein [Clostridium gasigenes]MBU3135035.1 hypothetical protein [Clostridium gasigenes]
MRDKILDCRNLETTLKSLEEILGLESEKITEYIENHKGSVDVEEFLDEIGIENPIISHIIIQHLTTASDECESIKKYGIVNTKKVLEWETSLNRFLKENDIYFDFTNDNVKLFFKNKEVKLVKHDSFNRNLTLHKLTKDFQINGFLKVDKILEYSFIKYYPEIINEISEITDSSLVYKWLEITKPYVLFCKVNLNSISSYYTFNDSELELDEIEKSQKLLDISLKYLSGENTREEYIFLNNEYEIPKEGIIDMVKLERI